MIPLWNPVIRPLVDTVDVSRLLEVGAEKGRSTRLLLNYLKRRGAVLECIDPVPEFDDGALQSEYPQALRYHKDLSLKVIPGLQRFQVGLLDGDHNWYTVYNELKQIEALHGSDGAEFPLLFLHDVGWPYGRRDLYYDPDTIPAEFRQPYARQGILPGKSELHAERGMNIELCNATHSGGPRNGVLTGIEDFVGESALSLRLIVLPVYFGLAIVVSEQRVENNPALSRALEDLLSAQGWQRLCVLTEHLRCVANVFLQTVDRQHKADVAEFADSGT